jgi:hypothetical protein
MDLYTLVRVARRVSELKEGIEQEEGSIQRKSGYRKRWMAIGMFRLEDIGLVTVGRGMARMETGVAGDGRRMFRLIEWRRGWLEWGKGWLEW